MCRCLTEDLGFLKAVAKNPFGIVIYRIDVPTIEQSVSEHMKEKLRQLKLSDIRLKQNESLREVVKQGGGYEKLLRKEGFEKT